jgi:hypothetical protein
VSDSKSNPLSQGQLRFGVYFKTDPIRIAATQSDHIDSRKIRFQSSIPRNSLKFKTFILRCCGSRLRGQSELRLLGKAPINCCRGPVDRWEQSNEGFSKNRAAGRPA